MQGKLESYRHQVGGHCRLVKPGGSLKVYKPHQLNECKFYENLNRPSQDKSLSELKPFIPKYFGTTDISMTIFDEETSDSRTTVLQHIVLEDLLYGFKKPCVVDIKMGRRQRTLNATAEKIRMQEMKALETTSHSLGFRICGCQFYDRTNDILCYRDKYWGRNLTAEGVSNMFRLWFWGQNGLSTELVEALITRLVELESIIASLSRWRFWSCSLLVAYDAGSTCEHSMINSLCVKLIDFANTVKLDNEESCDEDLIFGLRNICQFLNELLLQSRARTANDEASPAQFPSVSPWNSHIKVDPSNRADVRSELLRDGMLLLDNYLLHQQEGKSGASDKSHEGGAVGRFNSFRDSNVHLEKNINQQRQKQNATNGETAEMFPNDYDKNRLLKNKDIDSVSSLSESHQLLQNQICSCGGCSCSSKTPLKRSSGIQSASKISNSIPAHIYPISCCGIQNLNSNILKHEDPAIRRQKSFLLNSSSSSSSLSSNSPHYETEIDRNQNQQLLFNISTYHPSSTQPLMMFPVGAESGLTSSSESSNSEWFRKDSI